MEPFLIVHGGAGRWEVPRPEKEKAEGVLRLAVEAGLDACRKGGSVDAVAEAVRSMEDSGLLNAGRGAHVNIKGDIELDAGIMAGSAAAGAVGCVRGVPNPVLLARAVMERTGHVLLVSGGAERLAEACGLRRRFAPTRARREKHREELGAYLSAHPWAAGMGHSVGDTVGAVAVDSAGGVAAATSTGGTPFKLPGRVGDSPIPGAGFYAVDGRGAASATGTGEAIMRHCLCLRVVDSLGRGRDPASVLAEQVGGLSKRFGKGSAGVIAVDSKGRGAAHADTPAMAVAFGRAGGKVVVEVAGARRLRLLSRAMGGAPRKG
ncbi:MAG: isoaspartyl peptidase/L-asparaginase [Nitrososphaerota archaeon]|nr:isoaspartyl peptidase/L-asparaginase [Nitrososphaerota archaeon]MDG6939996.1 isoaspartyl peptidase/L-asparaginase [Nitrososphaerota archaeon]